MKNIHKIRENIYITNDEEIKKGEWVLFMFDEVTEIVKVTTINNNAFESKQGFGYGLEYCKKIILTTDKDLIKDGVQAIQIEIKQETTLEEAAREYYKRGQLGFEKAADTERAFLRGGLWQSERSYSEEDVKNAFLDGWQLRDGDLPFPKAKNKWFNEFKKK